MAPQQPFEALEKQLANQEVNLKNSLNNIEGADIAKLSIESAQQELAYNASLAIGANLMQVSLLDFLR
jgi:Bacterial flagellin C-terminal helical region.